MMPRFRASLALLLLSCTALSARAQTPTSGSTAGSGLGSQAENIVVSARLRDEPAQSVPVPMTVTTGDLLTLRQIWTPRQLNQIAPSLTITQANPRQTILGIRGIGGTTQVSDGLDSAVGVYLDGVYLGRPGEFAFNMFDIQQIDVLRGPQGTLYGRNTIGGAINIVSNQPSFTRSATLQADYGNYDLRQYHAVINTPIVPDKVAVRLMVYDTKRYGFLYDALNQSHENANDSYGLRAETLFRLTPDLDYTLSVLYNRADEPQGAYQYLANQPVAPNGFSFSRSAALVNPAYHPINDIYSRTTDNDARQFDNTHQFLISGHGDWRLGSGMTLTSITAYQTWAFYPVNDTDFTALPIGTNNNFIDHVNQFSQELRLASPTGRRIEWLAGLYGYNQNVTGESASLSGPDAWAFNSTLAGLANGTSRRAGALSATLNGLDYRTHEDPQTNSYAAFAQSSWHMDPRWTLTAGFRETYELRRQSDDAEATGNTQLLTCANTGRSCSFGGVALPQATLAKAATSFPAGNDVFASHENLYSGLATLSYQAMRHVMLYATYTHSAQSAGLNVAPLNAQLIAQGATNAVAPENADSFEVGTKSSWFRGRLVANLNLYWETVHDYQTNAVFLINGSARQALTNAGGIRSRGAEFDGTVRLTSDLGLVVGASFNDAVYTNFNNAPCAPEQTALGRSSCSLTGSAVANAPRWIVNLSPTWQHEFDQHVTGYASGGYSFRSSQFLTTDDAAGGHIGGYAQFDLRAGIRFGDRQQFDLAGWAHNLFNKNALLNIQENNGAFLAYADDPRTVGATLRVSF
jgi:iron complex outermembrane recepter protein